MYRSSCKPERIGRDVDSRYPYHLTAVIHLKRNAVQPFAERSQIHNLVSLPEHSMVDPRPSRRIDLPSFRASRDPAPRIDPADIAATTAGKRAELGQRAFVPSKNVRIEAARDGQLFGSGPLGSVIGV